MEHTTVSPSTVVPRLGDPAARALHERAVRGDRLAVDQLATQLLSALQRRLRRRFPRAPDDSIVNAVEDALLDYAARPARFDPSRGVPLEAYILRASTCNLVDDLRAEHRRRARESRYASSVLFDSRSPGLREFEPRYDQQTLDTELDFSAMAANDSEASALRLWLGGEKRWPRLAEALGARELPPDQQRAEVKRFKDRILSRLRRWLLRRS